MWHLKVARNQIFGLHHFQTISEPPQIVLRAFCNVLRQFLTLNSPWTPSAPCHQALWWSSCRRPSLRRQGRSQAQEPQDRDGPWSPCLARLQAQELAQVNVCWYLKSYVHSGRHITLWMRLALAGGSPSSALMVMGDMTASTNLTWMEDLSLGGVLQACSNAFAHEAGDSPKMSPVSDPETA
jgi:hypothetical protein